MHHHLKKISAVFFRTQEGKEPVRQWLKLFSKRDRKIIGDDIATLEFGWPIGMPLCRPMGHGLWEIRSKISQGCITRIFFCFAKGQLVLLHGFLKKTQKTPNNEIVIAYQPMREVFYE